MSEKLTFEASMRRLEEIVRIMEKGDTELENSMKLFNEGTQLINHCNKLLEEARLQVKAVVPGEDGTPSEKEFLNE